MQILPTVPGNSGEVGRERRNLFKTPLWNNQTIFSTVYCHPYIGTDHYNVALYKVDHFCRGFRGEQYISLL